MRGLYPAVTVDDDGDDDCKLMPLYLSLGASTDLK